MSTKSILVNLLIVISIFISSKLYSQNIGLQSFQNKFENNSKREAKSDRPFSFNNQVKSLKEMGKDTGFVAIPINSKLIFNSQKAKAAVSQNATSSAGTNSTLNTESKIVVYPSPNSSALINQIDDGLNLYTGAKNLNVPLYTFISRDIEVPISLSYHGSGVKVDEIASWVGLGWNLNSGGSITRIMKGLPDEFSGTVAPLYNNPIPAYGYLNLTDKVILENYLTYSSDQKKRIVRCASFSSYDWNNSENGYGGGSNPQAWDTQPDEFYFSFGQYSGKFVFAQDGNIYTIPHQNFEISKTVKNINVDGTDIPKIVEFIVKTDDGYIYKFGDANLSSVEETKNEQTRLNTNFQYAYTNKYSIIGDVYVYLYYRYPQINIVAKNGNIYYDNYAKPGNSSLSTYAYFTSTWHLKEIISPTNDQVSFSYTSVNELTYTQNRSYSTKLPNISEMQFTDGWYFVSPDAPVSNPAQTFLTFPNLQSFTYNVNETSLKAKRLSSISSTNGNMIKFNANTDRTDFYGENRLDNVEVFHNAQKIKKITFSYDNSQSDAEYDFFNFSPYDGVNGNGPFMDADLDFINQKYLIQVSNGVTINQSEYVQKYTNIFSAEHNRMYLKKVTDIASDNSLNTLFAFSYNLDGKLPRRFSSKQDKWGFFNTNNRGTKIPSISYTGSGNDQVPRSGFALIGWDNYQGATSDWSYKGAIQQPNAILTQYGILTNYVNSLGGKFEYKYELNKSGTTDVGGLRVNESLSIPDVSNNISTISTKYEYLGGKEVSSRIYTYGLTSNALLNEAHIFSSSDPINTVFNTNGGVVGYRTIKKSNTGNGKAISIFKSPNEVPNVKSPQYYNYETVAGYDKFPYPHDLDKDWQRGLLEETSTTLDDESKILNKKVTSYNLEPTEYTKKVIKGLLPGIMYITSYGVNYEQYSIGLYSYESNWVKTNSTSNLSFSSSDPGNLSKAISTSSIYEYKVNTYNNKQYVFMSKEIANQSDGLDITTEFKYPLDITDPSDVKTTQTVIDKMKVNHLFDTKLKVEMFKNSKQIYGQINTPSLINGDRMFPSSSIIIKSKYLYETSEYKEKESFGYSGYYAGQASLYNKLTDYSYTDGFTSYFWGYSYSYPIAKIENVSSRIVTGRLTQLGFDPTNLTATEDQSLLIGAFNALRSAYPDMRITSYTFNPLIGMSTETDPNGITKYYTYDIFNRLKNIKDQDGKILKQYEYHSKNEIYAK